MRRRKEALEETGVPDAPPPPPGALRRGGISSGGRDRVAVGGEIRPTSGELIDSRYEKIDLIGSGGIGTVYRARQVPLAREVALKEIRELFGFFAEDQHSEIVRRFTEVVRKAASLAHPNILPIHDVNLDREHPYLISELAPNGSARRLIQDAETIPVDLALRYLVQTLHALRVAHHQGVFHRGLKPENLLLDDGGNIKVTDFGFARIVERDASVIRQVYVGMGAVAYMAPELFSDPANSGAQSDIYALGIIFYELLTRRLPGRRSPMPSEIDAKLPKGLDDIFDTMTRDAREERYSSVDDILEDFDKLQGLSDVLDARSQFAVADNPLEKLRFRARPDDAPGEAVAVDGADVIATDDDDNPKPRRPYSFQQRNRKP
jgi:serine/threonine protein kinase